MDTQNISLIETKYIIVYDGYCHFCQFWVRWLLKRDKHDSFYFTAFQSNFSKQHLQFDTAIQLANSVVVFYGKKTYTAFAALYIIAQQLGGFYAVLFRVFNVLPTSWCNKAYYIVAKRRYTWFGKSKACHVPAQQHRLKFLL